MVVLVETGGLPDGPNRTTIRPQPLNVAKEARMCLASVMCSVVPSSACWTLLGHALSTMWRCNYVVFPQVPHISTHVDRARSGHRPCLWKQDLTAPDPPCMRQVSPSSSDHQPRLVGPPPPAPL